MASKEETTTEIKVSTSVVKATPNTLEDTQEKASNTKHSKSISIHLPLHFPVSIDLSTAATKDPLRCLPSAVIDAQFVVIIGSRATGKSRLAHQLLEARQVHPGLCSNPILHWNNAVTAKATRRMYHNVAQNLGMHYMAILEYGEEAVVPSFVFRACDAIFLHSGSRSIWNKLPSIQKKAIDLAWDELGQRFEQFPTSESEVGLFWLWIKS